MPYKDPAKAKANALERAKRYRERHRERQKNASLAWYYRNREAVLAKKKEWYQKNHEKALEEARARKQAAKERKRAAKAAVLEERNLEMGLQINRCPLCKSAGAAKVKGSVYLAGCSRQKCEKWVGGDEAFVGKTMVEAIEGWNKWTEEELAEQEEAKRLEAEMAAEVGEEEAPVDVGDPDDEGAVDGDSPDEDEDLFDGDDGGDEDAGDDGDEEGDEDAGEGEDAEPGEEAEPEEGDEAAAEGEDGETFARFWLELDGKWYWLAEAEEEGTCTGCAFCFEFGRRTVCAATSSDDFSEACELCKRLNGVWQEGEATEAGGDEG